MKTETVNNEMSLSKQRKLARKKEIARIKQRAVIFKISCALIAVLIIGLITWLIVSSAIKKAKQVTADRNFSAQLNDNGLINGVKAADYVTLPDYKNIEANKADFEYSDWSVEEDIDEILEDHMVPSDSMANKAEDGDKVNIDYVGTVDGEEFEGGSATGSDLVLGSGTFIDDFEEQIEGHTPGDKFNVEVTFPDDYKTESLQGEDAVFAVTLNSIYVKPEFTDEFVKENLSEHASTADEYRKYLKDKNYEEKLQDFVKDYILDNTVVTKTPSDYLKRLKSNYKQNDYDSYEYMNALYSQYYGTAPYSSFENFLSTTYSMTEEEYDESLEEKVTDDLKFTLFCQAVAEAEGITSDIDRAKEYYLEKGGTEDSFNSQIESYGTGYVAQLYLDELVVEKVCELVKVK